MKRVVLFTSMVLCVLAVIGQNHAFAHPTVPSGQVSFSFDVSGFATGENLATDDSAYYYAAFGISNSDGSWVDSWEEQLYISGQTTGDSQQTIDWQMNRTYNDLIAGQTYSVSWIVYTVGASYGGQFSGKMKGRMSSNGVAWLDGTNEAYAEAVSGVGSDFIGYADDFAQGPSFAFATANLGPTIYTDSWAKTNLLSIQSELSLHPEAGWSSTAGYGLFFGTFEPAVIPAPGAVILGGIGVGMVSWLAKTQSTVSRHIVGMKA